jgi:hypothetical protein
VTGIARTRNTHPTRRVSRRVHSLRHLPVPKPSSQRVIGRHRSPITGSRRNRSGYQTLTSDLLARWAPLGIDLEEPLDEAFEADREKGPLLQFAVRTSG